MAKDKESTEVSPKILTKKHLAKLERENRQKKFLLIGIIAVVVVILGLITYGILSNTVFKSMKPVAKVGNTTITVKQFQDRVGYDRYQMVQTFVTYASSYFASFFQTQLLQVQGKLDNYIQFGSDSLDQMINETALVQKAKSMGITVSDDEVEQEVRTSLGYYPSGTPTPVVPTPTITYYPTSTLSALQIAMGIHTPTATLPPTEVPLPTETPAANTPAADSTFVVTGGSPTATATLEPPTATATELPTEIPTITPTATEYTYAGYQNLYATVVANINTNATFTEQELRDYVRTILYERKVYAEVVKSVPTEQDMVWARHILVATKETADEVETKLKNGEDWYALAAEYSTDTANNTTGGDLGWFTKGTMLTAFEDVAWSMEIGATSDPVQTDYGYHIIQVLGHENRQLTADQITTAQTAAYNKFISDAKTELTFKKYDTWASVVPSEPTIPAQYRIATTTATTTP